MSVSGDPAVSPLGHVLTTTVSPTAVSPLGHVLTTSISPRGHPPTPTLEGGRPVRPRLAPVQEDIVIPTHLLAANNNYDSWHPETARARRASIQQPDIAQPFDYFGFQSVFKQQSAPAPVPEEPVTTWPIEPRRPASISIGALNRSRVNGADSRRGNDMPIAGRRAMLRRTSMPTVSEKSSSATLVGQASDRTLRRHFSETVDPFDTVKPPSLIYDEKPVPKSARVRWSNNSISIDPYDWRKSATTLNDEEKQAKPAPPPAARRGTVSSFVGRMRGASVFTLAGNAFSDLVQTTTQVIRRSSMYDVLENAKMRAVKMRRTKWGMIAFEYTFYLILLCFVYFVLVGRPLWGGAVWWLYWVVANKFVVAGTWSITIGLAIVYAYAPLLCLFEKDLPMPGPEKTDPSQTPGVHNTALLIPCYKAATIIGPTLVAACKVFPPSHIFVIANGNSPTPLDNTEDVIRPFGVNHIWSPVGSKIVAQFVGCYAARSFTNVLMIDDDCALPANFPIVSERMTGKVKSIGYTIKSVGPLSSKGTLCQQAQDFEYKISGLQRIFAGKIGSATFPHGAISLWDTEFLIKTFHTHPGFSVSEDWFFGHIARKLGCRIQMTSHIFVETETPTDVFFSSGGARGGFGEMTIFKQRFYRWNFFFVNGMYFNMAYILGSWKLGWWELGAKLFVFQEVYETLLYLFAPFILPISLIVRPAFCAYLMVGTFGLYFVNAAIFNELHLRLKKERVSSFTVYVYYMPFKIALTAVSIASCYYSIWKYATYFAKRHPKVIEDEKAVEVVLRLQEQTPVDGAKPNQGRRMTVVAIDTRVSDHRLSDVAEDAPERPEFTNAIDFA